MTGCVAITCSDLGRYSGFTESLARLETPPGTKFYFAKGSDREVGRNKLVGAMMDSGDDWLLFLDDDSVFAPDLLMRLLARDVDVVGALYLRRDMPFTALAYESMLDDGRMVPLNLNEHPQDALVQVKAVGTGGMLVKRHVFANMEGGKWFRRDEPYSEDIFWCLECGCDIHVDLGARIGHMTIATVWPSEARDKWAVGFTITEQFNFLVPME